MLPRCANLLQPTNATQLSDLSGQSSRRVKFTRACLCLKEWETRLWTTSRFTAAWSFLKSKPKLRRNYSAPSSAKSKTTMKELKSPELIIRGDKRWLRLLNGTPMTWLMRNNLRPKKQSGPQKALLRRLMVMAFLLRDFRILVAGLSSPSITGDACSHVKRSDALRRPITPRTKLSVFRHVKKALDSQTRCVDLRSLPNVIFPTLILSCGTLPKSKKSFFMMNSSIQTSNKTFRFHFLTTSRLLRVRRRSALSTFSCHLACLTVL